MVYLAIFLFFYNLYLFGLNHGTHCVLHSHLDGDIEEAELGLGLGGEVRRLQLVGHHLQDRHCELVEQDTLVGENIRLAEQEPLVDKNSKETKA